MRLSRCLCCPGPQIDYPPYRNEQAEAPVPHD
jgi:hypothetical protein